MTVAVFRKIGFLVIFLVCHVGVLYSQPHVSSAAIGNKGVTETGAQQTEHRIKAFPGSQGFGAFAQGGRGGRVLQVTNLEDNGKGSLRWAIQQEGPRTIVFRVSGTIILQSELIIENPYITIAGQTAPGDGICIRDGSLVISTHNVVIRYLRSRLGDRGERGDAISISEGHDIIVDHCSASWSTDEVLSASTGAPDLTNVTVQWCFITEALNFENHGFGSLIRGTEGARYSFHHNLYAHNRGRNPRPGNYDRNPRQEDPDGLLLDFRNNVIYNWGGAHAGYNADSISITKLNYVGNFLISGPDSENNGIAYQTGSPFNKAYFQNNYYNFEKPENRWDIVNFGDEWSQQQIEAYKRTRPFPSGSIVTDGPQEAFEQVLAHGGASLPKRDPVDARVVNDIRNRTGTIIDSQSEVGGWPKLQSEPAPEDSDRDGMPDRWEETHGLDPGNAADRNKTAADGYTMLEKYLHSLL